MLGVQGTEANIVQLFLLIYEMMAPPAWMSHRWIDLSSGPEIIMVQSLSKSNPVTLNAGTGNWPIKRSFHKPQWGYSLFITLRSLHSLSAEQSSWLDTRLWGKQSESHPQWWYSHTQSSWIIQLTVGLWKLAKHCDHQEKLWAEPMRLWKELRPETIQISQPKILRICCMW